MTTSDDDLTEADVFTVVMIDVLREPFEQWLAQRELKMFQIPGTDVWSTTPTGERVLREMRLRGAP